MKNGDSQATLLYDESMIIVELCLVLFSSRRLHALALLVPESFAVGEVSGRLLLYLVSMFPFLP